MEKKDKIGEIDGRSDRVLFDFRTRESLPVAEDEQNQTDSVLAERLMVAMARKEVDADELADAVGIQRNRVYRLLKGSRPKDFELVQLARYLEVTFEFLLDPDADIRIKHTLTLEQQKEINSASQELLSRPVVLEMLKSCKDLPDESIQMLIEQSLFLEWRKKIRRVDTDRSPKKRVIYDSRSGGEKVAEEKREAYEKGA